MISFVILIKYPFCSTSSNLKILLQILKLYIAFIIKNYKNTYYHIIIKLTIQYSNNY